MASRYRGPDGIMRPADHTFPTKTAAEVWLTRKEAEANEDLRGLLNAGHQRNRPAIRWDAGTRGLETIPTFAMAALVGIGAMPDTIEDRAVVVAMRRRAPGDSVAPFRYRRDRPALTEIAAALSGWLGAHLAELERAEPVMPLEDRAADTWEPLIAVADLADEDWPELARHAAVVMTTDHDAAAKVSDRIRLLTDIRAAFATLAEPEAVTTAEQKGRSPDMTKRRSRGDGGLHWEVSRQRWIATITVGYDGRGKRITRKASDKTKGGALAKLKENLRDHEDGLAVGPQNYTVANAVKGWLEFGLSNRDPATTNKCRILAAKHVMPALGARKLRELSADDIDRWLSAKAKTLSTDTLRQLRSILKRSVSRAQAHDKVKRNVVLLCDVPTGQDVSFRQRLNSLPTVLDKRMSVHISAHRATRNIRDSGALADGELTKCSTSVLNRVFPHV